MEGTCLGIFEKTIRDTSRPVGTTMPPGLPLASATAKAVPAAVPVGLVKVQNGGRRISSEREHCIQLGHQLVVLKVQPNFFDWYWLGLKGFFLGFFCHPIEFVIPQEELKHPTRVVHESSFWLRSCLKRKISWDMSHRIVSNKEGHWKIHQR